MTSPVRHCLLVVDDEPDICDSIRDLLRRRYRVLTAQGADEGYRLLQSHEVHMVMTDQRMPRVTGVELLTRVRAQYPRAVRMLFTGYADVDSVIAAINHGHVYRFLKKPWDPAELEAAVDDAAAEHDRLVAQATEAARLRDEVADLRQRVSSLEVEIQRLSEP